MICPTWTGVGGAAGSSALSSVCSSCHSDLKSRSDVPSERAAGQRIASEHQDHRDSQCPAGVQDRNGKHHYLHMQLVTLK